MAMLVYRRVDFREATPSLLFLKSLNPVVDVVILGSVVSPFSGVDGTELGWPSKNRGVLPPKSSICS